MNQNRCELTGIETFLISTILGSNFNSQNRILEFTTDHFPPFLFFTFAGLGPLLQIGQFFCCLNQSVTQQHFY